MGTVAPAFLLHLPFRGQANLRNHRKIIVVDGRQAVVGGMNLADEYMGPTPHAGRWRDLSARISGPAVRAIEAIFAADWAFATHQPGQPLASRPTPPPAGSAQVQMVASGPDVTEDALYDALLTALFGAKIRIWIATPYFVPDEALARALVLAHPAAFGNG